MIYEFGGCRLDPDSYSFTRDGDPKHLEPQVFDLLLYLAQHPGEVIGRDRLVESVWKGLNVSDSAIGARIAAARAAVGDTGKDQRIIRTVHRRGFQLAVPVSVPGNAAEPPAEAAPAAGNRQTVRFTRAADGASIAWAESGTGPPLLRVGHWLSHLELDWDSPVWQPLIAALGARHRLIRYDQRGTGLSTRKLDNVTLEHFVSDLEAVADAAGLERFPMIAASQASPVAIAFAARNPERVSGMVLYGGYAVGRVFRDSGPGDMTEETILALIRAGWGQAGSAFVNAFSSLFMPDATREQLDSFVRMQLASIAPDKAALLRSIVDRFMVVDLLDQIRVPTLVIHSEGDAIHPIAQGRLLASEIPGARFVTLDSRNHVPLPQLDSWQRMMREIRAFLDDI